MILRYLVISCATWCTPQQDYQGSFAIRSPGVVGMVGTELTITFDPASGSYKIEDHGTTRTTADLDEAMQSATEMAAKMRQVGITP
jgi:hypothetical protein